MRYIIGCKVTDKEKKKVTEYILTIGRFYGDYYPSYQQISEIKHSFRTYYYDNLDDVLFHIKALKFSMKRHNLDGLCFYEEEDNTKKCLTFEFYPIKIDSLKCPYKFIEKTGTCAKDVDYLKDYLKKVKKTSRKSYFSYNSGKFSI